MEWARSVAQKWRCDVWSSAEIAESSFFFKLASFVTSGFFSQHTHTNSFDQRAECERGYSKHAIPRAVCVWIMSFALYFSCATFFWRGSTNSTTKSRGIQETSQSCSRSKLSKLKTPSQRQSTSLRPWHDGAVWPLGKSNLQNASTNTYILKE
jgi:hypothetical protein